MRKFNQAVLASSLSAALLLTGATGCMTDRNERTAGRYVDDVRLTSKVKDALRDEPVYKFSDVDVKTFNGVVQLSGFVNSEEQKARAGELAQGVDGVTQVVNGITLKPTVPTPTGRPTQTPPR